MVDDPDGADAPMVGDHLVVMGTDGGTGLRRQLFGNVAERVLRRVAVSVMTVREEDPDLLEFDETAGRRRTRAGRRGVPLLVLTISDRVVIVAELLTEQNVSKGVKVYTILTINSFYSNLHIRRAAVCHSR